MAHPVRRLVLLRHGRTEWNHDGRAQGQADVPLDEVGRSQARAAAALLATLRPARLWSSDLLRARMTAAPLAARCRLPVTEDARLREFDVGERAGLTWAESVAAFPQIADGVGLGERLVGVPGAESDADVAARIVPAVEECLGALAPGETGIVVSHGAALKLALAGLLGWDEPTMRSVRSLDNCHWASVVASGDGAERRLAQYGVGDFASTVGIG